MVNRSIEKCQENIRKLKENSTLIQKQVQLEELEKVLRGLDSTINSDREKIGGMRTRIQDLLARKQTLLEKQVSGKGEVTALGAAAKDRLNAWNQEYEKAMGGKTIEQFQSEYFISSPLIRENTTVTDARMSKNNM